MTPGLTWYSLNDNNFKTKKQLFGTTKAVDVIFSSHLKSATSQPTQNRSFRRRSSQPISWLSRPIEKTKPNTTKGNLQEKQKYIICVVQNEHTKSHAWPPLTNGTSGLETKLIYCCNQPRSQSQHGVSRLKCWQKPRSGYIRRQCNAFQKCTLTTPPSVCELQKKRASGSREFWRANRGGWVLGKGSASSRLISKGSGKRYKCYQRSPRRSPGRSTIFFCTLKSPSLQHFRHCWLGVRKSIQPVKWGVGVVICLEWGADCLRMVQLMPLPSHNPIISCLV